MKLLIQPGDGVTPMVKAINGAKKSIDVLIFRFDRVEIENALVKAVSRGVTVRALIAYTNRGGEKGLRSLEMRLLAAGVTVARTDDDLIRYHGKIMIIDDHDLWLMAFNFTNIDIESSRSFGIVTTDKKIVAESISLFDADSKRVPYTPKLDSFVISPVNSRKVISEFLKGAKRELLIYDPAVTDPAMAQILNERSRDGVKIRILGKLSRRVAEAEVHPLFIRLHTRTIIRDGKDVFLGSQSLRTEELDARREIGLIFRDSKISERMIEVFEKDWKESQGLREKRKSANAADAPPAKKVAKKVAKTVAKTMSPVAPVLEVVVRELTGSTSDVNVDPEELEATVKDAVKSAIQEVVTTAVEQVAKQAE
jgi:phosphatidylserine/phosphatidylglycerophosphate/cardiolipin synthase-like enzyme